MTTSQPPHESAAAVRAYHERTKHHPHRYARSLGFLDWSTQPDPFRRWLGAPLLPLDVVAPGVEPSWAAALDGLVEPAPLDRGFISRLFGDSLALSAWKVMGSARWALRVNPSSGNLHPTEGTLVAGPVPGLMERPTVCHYAPHEHALEQRAALDDETWAALAVRLPPGAVLVGLSSIPWREAWKYGERAWRYCQHDVGHAVAAVALAAAMQGWSARVLDALSDADVAALLGIDGMEGPEAEHPDCVLVLSPALGGGQMASRPPDAASSHPSQPREAPPDAPLPEELRGRLLRAPWRGVPSALSPNHHPWPVIDEVARAAEKGPGTVSESQPMAVPWAPPDASARVVVHQRRSAVSFDGRTALPLAAFIDVLAATLPGRGPLVALPWRPRVHLLLFVHRVEGVTPGLYALPRSPSAEADLAARMDPTFAWRPVDGCPDWLPLRLLVEADARRAASGVSCNQDIAADGAFAVGMLAELADGLHTHGAAFYRRLHWEAGVVGHMLYLGAEVAGVRGTGIGCFFDDLTAEVAGLRDAELAALYHFTVGSPEDDTRLQTEPPYGHLQRNE